MILNSSGKGINPMVSSLNRAAAIVSYDGTNYNGWQRLPDNISIQETLEKAISKVANLKTKIYASGRTDSGVHASYQVIHFDYYDSQRDIESWVRGTNRYLPPSIRVHQAICMPSYEKLDDNWKDKYPRGKTQHPLPDLFHSRFSALARHYRYFIYNGKVAPSLLNKRCYWYQKYINDIVMQEAANCLVGEHDFSSFRDGECQAINRRVCVKYIKIRRKNDWICIDISANAFLKQMVRNIVGSLMLVGLNKKSIKWFHDLLEQKNRSLAGGVAPACGLYLVAVDYPPHYNLPSPIDTQFMMPYQGIAPYF